MKKFCTSVLFVALFVPVSAEAECSLKKVADYTVEWVGTGWGTRTLEYAWVCDPVTGGSTTGTGPTSPPTSPTNPAPTTPPTMYLIGADTSTPNRISIFVEGNAVVTSAEVILDGSISISRYAGSLVEGITMSGPGIGSLTPGSHAVSIRGCTSSSVCAVTEFRIARTPRPSGTSSSFTATWFESQGPVVVAARAAYGLNLGEEAVNTSYSGVSPMYDATRVMFKEQRMSVSWWQKTLNPDVQYTSRHFAARTGPAEYANGGRLYKAMAMCATPLVIGDGDTYRSACSSQLAWGGQPTGGVELTSLYLLGNTGLYPAGITNSTLSYELP